MLDVSKSTEKLNVSSGQEATRVRKPKHHKSKTKSKVHNYVDNKSTGESADGMKHKHFTETTNEVPTMMIIESG